MDNQYCTVTCRKGLRHARIYSTRKKGAGMKKEKKPMTNMSPPTCQCRQGRPAQLLAIWQVQTTIAATWPLASKKAIACRKRGWWRFASFEKDNDALRTAQDSAWKEQTTSIVDKEVLEIVTQRNEETAPWPDPNCQSYASMIQLRIWLQHKRCVLVEFVTRLLKEHHWAPSGVR